MEDDMRAAIWVGAVGAIAAYGVIAAGQSKLPELRPNLEGHRGGVTAITFNGDGSEIATGAGNGIVRIWNAKTGKLKSKQDELRDFKGISITGLTFAQDGSTLAASGKGRVGLWSPVELKVPRADSGTNPKTARFDEFKSYRWLAFPSTDSEADYADSATTGDGKEVYITRRHKSFNYPGRVLRYDKVRDLTEERPGPKYLDPRAVACISDPDSGLAAVYASTGEKGEGNSAVLLYGLGDTKIITRGVPPLTNKSALPRITFSTDGKWLAAYAGTLALWPVPGSHIIGGDPTMLEGVFAAAIGPKNLMATVSPQDESQNASVVLWKLEAQTKRYGLFGVHWMKQTTEVKKVDTLQTNLKDVSCLAFSPDPNGVRLAIGGTTDGVVQLWKLNEY
jgi:WD40 repeat protein